MPVIIPPGYMQVTFHFEGQLIPDGTGATVFGVALGGAEPGIVLADCATTWLAQFQGSLHSSISFTRATGITFDTSHEVIVDEFGEATGDPAPPNVCLHVRKVTGFRGRRAVGHMYPPGLLYDEAIGVNGVLSTSVQEGRQDQYAAWLTEMAAPMVLLNRSEGTSPAPEAPRVVEALLVDTVVSTQRRRLR